MIIQINRNSGTSFYYTFLLSESSEGGGSDVIVPIPELSFEAVKQVIEDAFDKYEFFEMEAANQEQKTFICAIAPLTLPQVVERMETALYTKLNTATM